MSKITLIPTPVGNLEDITLRAIRLLREADLIAAEDTRKTGILLKHHQISTPMASFHQHNEHKKSESLINEVLNKGLKLVLVSDAGTPGISDPGFLLVRDAVKAGIIVETLPGATAFVPALVNSGLPCDRFVFEGFIPVKKGRKTRLDSLKEEKRTMIFYESPHRLPRTLRDFSEYFGADRQASVSREISKIYEETVRGSLAELMNHFSENVKGEIVVVVEGKGKNAPKKQEND